MMRMVCPICGEEPQKGVRHICRRPEPEITGSQVVAVQADEMRPPLLSSAGGIERRKVGGTPAAAAVASISALVSKSSGPLVSKKALCRTKGNDFLVAFLAEALGDSNAWRKDPKKALLLAVNQVRNEAARSLQGVWRRCLAALRARKQQPPAGNGVYQRLALPAP